MKIQAIVMFTLLGVGAVYAAEEPILVDGGFLSNDIQGSPKMVCGSEDGVNFKCRPYPQNPHQLQKRACMGWMRCYY